VASEAANNLLVVTLSSMFFAADEQLTEYVSLFSRPYAMHGHLCLEYRQPGHPMVIDGVSKDTMRSWLRAIERETESKRMAHMGNMKYIIYGVIGLAVIGFLVSDGGKKPNVDLTQVLDRSVVAMDKYDRFLKQNKIEKATDEHLNTLNEIFQEELNKAPVLHSGLIATRFGKDAKFTGVDDANANKVADADETPLFTVELDAANKRLIATDTNGTGTQRGFSGMGFIAGAMIGSMLGRQRSAGIAPGSFSNRKVASPAAYNQARSRARSGGLRGGK
jgi:hypothetical protein